MKTIYQITLFIILITGTYITAYADGLIIPSNENYPSSVLKNKSTAIQIVIHGNIAETIVSQEFENEWDKPVAGVYSFPLPVDARATRLLYSKGDSLIEAVLKEKQQSTNPGTGEGGVTALINKYMGNNVVRIDQNEIPAFGTKTIVLHYIQTISQFNNQHFYQYPFATSDFVKTPLDFINISIEVNHVNKIENFSLNFEGEPMVKSSTNKQIKLVYSKAKAYAAKDIVFSYTTTKDQFITSIESEKIDSTDGYFCMTALPPISTTTEVFPKKMIFALCNSSTMIGKKLDQSKLALAIALDNLNPTDFFNVMLINSVTKTLDNEFLKATPENIAKAKEFIKNVFGQYGNSMQNALLNAFKLLNNDEIKSSSSVIIYTDGRGITDPFEIERNNINRIGLFFMAVGNDIDQTRIETTSSLNYGFVHYVNENDNLETSMSTLIHKISNPIVKNTTIEYNGGEIHAINPQKVPTIFTGTDIIQTGRYSQSGNVEVTISGKKTNEDFHEIFQGTLTESNEHDFCRKLWVKQTMDNLEAQILINNNIDSLRKELVAFSLAHNIKCRYTAYTIDDDIEIDPGVPTDWEDETKEVVTIKRITSTNNSKILAGYPNPFFNQGTIKIFISAVDIEKSKKLKIVDFCGRLIQEINLSDLTTGTHEIVINNNIVLQQGVYIIILEVNGKNSSQIKLIAN